MVERCCTAHEFDAYFMIATPHHAALATGLGFSRHMQGEVIRKIINVPDRQARPYFAHIYEFAPFENVVRRSFDPSWLVDHSPKEQTPIEKVRVH